MCCSACLCQLRSGAPAGEQPRRWLSFCSGTEIFCVWVVAGGGSWALALGFFFFLPAKCFFIINTRWFGISPVLAKAAREAALTSVHSGIEAVSGEGFVSYGAFMRL